METIRQGSEMIVSQMNNVGYVMAWQNRTDNGELMSAKEILFPMSAGEVIDNWKLVAPIIMIVIIFICSFFAFKFGGLIVSAHLMLWKYGEGFLNQWKVVTKDRVENTLPITAEFDKLWHPIFIS